ncbi:ABC transporter permease [Mesobacillus harenae]|uniref:ABC transporter permease n=1 Tax=Mesobacillus harenae TaxID=2213203 RepID=UPI00157FE725|nr:ABC transporter permease [Mesobacillus harenae]
MFKPEELWKQRFSRFVKETGRYLRYILNGHLVIVFLFLLGTGAYYYQEWVQTLTPSFPAAILLAVVLAILLTYSPIFTFLMEADKIFLLPLETKLSDYFKRSILFSLLLQSYLLLMALAVLMPIYAQVSGSGFSKFFLFLLAIIAVKLLNLMVRWQQQYYLDAKIHLIDSLVRFCVNVVFLYLLFSDAAWLLIIVTSAILFMLYWYYRSQTVDKGLKWEALIEADERRMTSFYRLANMFTDVPQMKDRVKRRKWLDWLVARLPFQQNSTYAHIFGRTFLRAGDYFGLAIRLTVIGASALYFISFGLGQILLVVLFLYLTGFQLLPLWSHHQYKLWTELYPVKMETKLRSFQRLLSTILYLQSLAFAMILVFKSDLMTALLSLLAGCLFAYFFVFIYSKKRISE